MHTKSVYALNVRLQSAGFKTQVKNHVSYQPIRIEATIAIAERREGVLAQLSDEAYAEGMTRLRQTLAEQVVEYQLGFEVGYVEVWAQKVHRVAVE